MLADPAPQHGGGHVVVAAFLLRLVQDIEHDAFLARQAVANVRDIVVTHLLFAAR